MTNVMGVAEFVRRCQYKPAPRQRVPHPWARKEGAMEAERRYVYLGDSLTRPELRGARCRAVLRSDGRCIRAGWTHDDRPGHEGKRWASGGMLVEFESGERVNVIGRLLRKEGD